MKRAICIAALTVIAAFSFWIYVYTLREKADSLVSGAYALSLSKANPTLIEVQQRYGKRLQLDGCDRLGCSYTVRLSNRHVAALRIVRFAEITSSFWVRDGVVLENILSYTVRDDRQRSITAHVQVDYCDRCDSFWVDPWKESSPTDANGIVEIGYVSSADEKRRVFSFDRSCIAAIRGCTNASALLPTVWEQTTNRAIRCLIANHEGCVRPPSDWPW